MYSCTRVIQRITFRSNLDEEMIEIERCEGTINDK